MYVLVWQCVIYLSTFYDGIPHCNATVSVELHYKIIFLYYHHYNHHHGLFFFCFIPQVEVTLVRFLFLVCEPV